MSARTAAEDGLLAAALVGLDGFGHAAVIALAGTFVAFARRFLRWSGQLACARGLRSIAGSAVVCAWLYLLYTSR